jgi:hypothetical protein
MTHGMCIHNAISCAACLRGCLSRTQPAAVRVSWGTWAASASTRSHCRFLLLAPFDCSSALVRVAGALGLKVDSTCLSCDVLAA